MALLLKTQYVITLGNVETLSDNVLLQLSLKARNGTFWSDKDMWLQVQICKHI